MQIQGNELLLQYKKTNEKELQKAKLLLEAEKQKATQIPEAVRKFCTKYRFNSLWTAPDLTDTNLLRCFTTNEGVSNDNRQENLCRRLSKRCY